ncbi:MAG TPA: isoprenylcysteine carboxylmethyltransferase family protein [Acetobacteraceae bacterium]|jgi:protein-S-isoprenylcysteine O-methyltransferase Ste14|nr:isoprenylcysteine carboxylmethyltransferase family protein [Acetobacteraceae bacterium]
MQVTAGIAVVNVVATILWLGLAVLGWGGFDAFFSHPPLLAVSLITLALVVAGMFTAGNISSGKQEDRGNRWVLAVFAVIGLLLAWLPAYTDRNDVWTLDGDTVRWCGVLLYAVGGVLRIWPVYVLGNRFSGLVAIQEGHALVTTGIYGVIRHPSYLGLLTMVLGWALAFRSGAGVLLTALFLVPLIARIHAEETLLRSHFGAEYDRYRARTSRLLPGIY